MALYCNLLGGLHEGIDLVNFDQTFFFKKQKWRDLTDFRKMEIY